MKSASVAAAAPQRASRDGERARCAVRLRPGGPEDLVAEPDVDGLLASALVPQRRDLDGREGERMGELAQAPARRDHVRDPLGEREH